VQAIIAGSLKAIPRKTWGLVLSCLRQLFLYIASAILALAMVSLLVSTTMTYVNIISLVLGGAIGIYLTKDASLAVDTLPKENELDGSDTAHLMGVWGVAGFIGSALGPLLGGPLLYIVGQDLPAHGSAVGDGSDLEEYSLQGYTQSSFVCRNFPFVCRPLSSDMSTAKANRDWTICERQTLLLFFLV
jgi:hypothetical protein